MTRSIKISPSLLAADFGAFAAEAIRVRDAGAEYLHFDVMDNHYVPNLTFGYELVEAVRSKTDAIFDVHLMIERPETLVASFAKAGADMLTIHAETTYHVHRVLTEIREAGMKAGIAVNPAVGIEQIQWILPIIDRVLIMTVNPGFGGQPFLNNVLPKIVQLREIEKRDQLSFEIGVDGGVSNETAPLVVEAGADVLIAGSAIFSHADGPAVAIAQLRAAAEEARRR
jgi:ribulose-phosphate 3-epimerase